MLRATEAGSKSGWQTRRLVGQTSVRFKTAGYMRVAIFGTLMSFSVGDKKVGDRVNLERAVGAHVRFGGHFVQVRCPLLYAELAC